MPKLVVFYNGTDVESDEKLLHLSDAFPYEKRDGSDIQVRVRMVNINKGHSPAMMAACRPLDEYAWTVEQVRLLEKAVGLEAASDQAIDVMPKDYLIKPFLEAHRAQVKTMLLTEYDEAKTLELCKEEGRQEGQQRFAALISRLLSLGRNADVERAANDFAYLEQLFREFQMV